MCYIDHLQAMQYFFPNKTVKEKNLFYQVSSKNFKIIYLQVWLDLPMDTNSVAYLQLNLSSKESCFKKPYPGKQYTIQPGLWKLMSYKRSFHTAKSVFGLLL